MCPNWLLDSSDRSQPNNGMHPTANSAALIENLRVITSRRGGLSQALDGFIVLRLGIICVDDRFARFNTGFTCGVIPR